MPDWFLLILFINQGLKWMQKQRAVWQELGGGEMPVEFPLGRGNSREVAGSWCFPCWLLSLPLLSQFPSRRAQRLSAQPSVLPCVCQRKVPAVRMQRGFQYWHLSDSSSSFWSPGGQHPCQFRSYFLKDEIHQLPGAELAPVCAAQAGSGKPCGTLGRKYPLLCCPPVSRAEFSCQSRGSLHPRWAFRGHQTALAEWQHPGSPGDFEQEVTPGSPGPWCLVTQPCLTLFDPGDCSPPGSSVHGDSPGRNTGVSCHFLLQGIFLTQRLNPHLLHWQAESLPMCRQVSPSDGDGAPLMNVVLHHTGAPKLLSAADPQPACPGWPMFSSNIWFGNMCGSWKLQPWQEKNKLLFTSFQFDQLHFPLTEWMLDRLVTPLHHSGTFSHNEAFWWWAQWWVQCFSPTAVSVSK